MMSYSSSRTPSSLRSIVASLFHSFLDFILGTADIILKVDFSKLGIPDAASMPESLPPLFIVNAQVEVNWFGVIMTLQII